MKRTREIWGKRYQLLGSKKSLAEAKTLAKSKTSHSAKAIAVIVREKGTNGKMRYDVWIRHTLRVTGESKLYVLI